MPHTATPADLNRLVTHVEILPVDPQGGPRLLAWANVTLLDHFVVKSVRVFQVNHRLRVQMPNEARREECSSCGELTSVLAAHCSFCGARLDRLTRKSNPDKPARFDLFHPITPEGRRAIETAVLRAYAAVAGREETKAT